MIQRYVHVGQLSDSYMGLVYFSHLKPHFVRRGDLDWGSMAPNSMTGEDYAVEIKLVWLFWCLYGKPQNSPF